MPILAQPPVAGGDLRKVILSEFFESLEFGFAIDIPRYANSQPLLPVEGATKGGHMYVYLARNGRQFSAGFEYLINTTDAKTIINARADSTIQAFKAMHGELAFDRPNKTGGFEGREFRVKLITGVTIQKRYLISGDRIFQLSAAWQSDVDDVEAARALDTFRLIDSKAIIAKRLEEATPAPLPQEPRVKRKFSDAEIDRLKGRVRSVFETAETIDSAGRAGDRLNKNLKEYNRFGDLTKEIYYDYRGNPSSVTVYGVIDGFRAMKRGDSLPYEYNPPPVMMAPRPAGFVAPPDIPSDERFSTRYEYKYDEKGRIIESISYDNQNKAGLRSVFEYDGKHVLETSHDRDGKLVRKTKELIDERGNPIETTYFSTSKSYPDDGVRKYKYLEFDKQGNWTKQEETGTTPKYESGSITIHTIRYRKISYY